jgi:abortive infection bacteriophage resistance protein
MYDKPWLSYEVQLTQLQSRGLLVTDQAKALIHLQRIGYYRLSGYLHDFRERSGVCCPVSQRRPMKAGKEKTDRLPLDTFKSGATFENAVELYLFDKKLRLFAVDALERIEIALRVDVVHTLGQLDKFAYLKPDLLHPSFSAALDPKAGLSEHHQWLSKHAGLINRSREKFIEHAKQKYGLPVPIWVACEVWDFGALSTLFSGMRETEQDQIAAKYGVRNGRVFASWLRSLSFLRNVCAHHSRLWNRNVADQPKLPSSDELAWIAPFVGNNHALARSFLLMCMVRHLLLVIHPTSGWPLRLREHLMNFPDLSHLNISLAGMGAIEGWCEWPMWQN